MALTKISTAMWNSVPHHDTHDFNVDDVLYVDVSANRVGIGTTNPTANLHLKSTGGITLLLEADSDNVTETDNPVIQFSQDGGGVTANIGLEGVAGTTFPTSGSNGFYIDSTEEIMLGTAGAERMRITSGGDLTIGGTSTNTAGSLNKGVYLQSQTDGDVLGYSLYSNEGTNNRRVNFFLDDTNAVYGFQTSYSSGAIDFVVKSAGNERMRLYSGGDISFRDTSTNEAFYWDASTASLGIGGIPTEKIEVFGNITSTASTDPTIKVKSSDANYQAQMRWNTTGNYLEFLTRYAGTYYTNTLVLDRGNVGIGTSPIALLHINGSGDAIRVTSTNTGAGGAQMDLLHFTTSPADNDVHGVINFGGYYSGTSSAYGSAIKSVWSDVSAKKADLQFFTRNDADFSERMRIDSSGDLTIKGGRIIVRESDDGNDAVKITRDADEGFVQLFSSGTQTIEIRGNGNSYFNGGNVGIGTTNPSNTTHIYKNATIGPITSTTTANAGLRIQDNGASMYFDGNSIVLDNTGYLTTNGAHDFVLGTNNTARIHIDSGGNIGIGTTSPANKLEVASSVNNVANFRSTTANSLVYIGDTTSTTSYSLLMFNSNSGTGQIWKAGTSYTSWGGAAALNIYNSNGAIALHPNGTTNALFLSTSGNVTANVDMRAPIFYDSDNTNYYVDPNSTSVLEAGRFGLTTGSWGSVYIATNTNAGWSTAAYPHIGSTGGSAGSLIMLHNPHIPFRTDNARSGASGKAGIRCAVNTSATGWWDIGLYGDAFEIYRGISSQQMFHVDNARNSYSWGSSRAPIFYDSDNTSYYVDPASTSNLNALTTYSYQGNGNVGGTGSASWHPSGIYSAGYNWLYGGINGGGGSATNFVDVRANIFYDYNNTGYYLDPAGTSNLNAVNVSNLNGYNPNNFGLFRMANGYFNNGTTTADFIADLGDNGHLATGFTATKVPWSYAGNSDVNTGITTIEMAGSAVTTWHDGAYYTSLVIRPTTGAGGGAVYIYNNQGSNYSPGWRQVWTSSTDNYNYSSIRSPIFYDIDNTTYYLDPTSTGAISSIRTAGGGQIGTSTAHKLTVAGNGNYMNINFDQIWNAGGNLHLQYSSGYNVDMCAGGGYAWSRTSLRAPIFYDSDNTAYYLNPSASGSLLRGGVNVRGGHSDTSIRLFLDGSENGANTGAVNLQAWCSEPGNTWDGAGFGYNVSNSINESGNVPAYYFGRHNTSLGQAYMRMLSDGNWNFYNTPSGSNTRYTTMQLTNSGYVFAPASVRSPIFYDSDNTAYYLNPNATGDSLRVAGDVIAYYSSDKRLKDNIIKIDSALDKVNAIGGYTFEWNEESHKETGSKDVGVIAQEVEEIFPEIVQTRSNGYKAVNYEKLVPLLIEAIKELSEKVKILENK